MRAARASDIEAQTRVERHELRRRIVADIDDGELKAPRDGRVQYRVAGRAKCYIGWRPGVEHGRLSDVLYDIFPATDRTGGVGEKNRRRRDWWTPRRITCVFRRRSVLQLASVARISRKTVGKTRDERLKLMLRRSAFRQSCCDAASGICQNRFAGNSMGSSG